MATRAPTPEIETKEEDTEDGDADILSNKFWYRVMSALIHETSASGDDSLNLKRLKKDVNEAHTLKEIFSLVAVQIAKSLTKDQSRASEAVSKEDDGEEKEDDAEEKVQKKMEKNPKI